MKKNLKKGFISKLLLPFLLLSSLFFLIQCGGGGENDGSSSTEGNVFDLSQYPEISTNKNDIGLFALTAYSYLEYMMSLAGRDLNRAITTGNENNLTNSSMLYKAVKSFQEDAKNATALAMALGDGEEEEIELDGDTETKETVALNREALETFERVLYWEFKKLIDEQNTSKSWNSKSLWDDLIASANPQNMRTASLITETISRASDIASGVLAVMCAAVPPAAPATCSAFAISVKFSSSAKLALLIINMYPSHLTGIEVKGQRGCEYYNYPCYDHYITCSGNPEAVKNESVIEIMGVYANDVSQATDMLISKYISKYIEEAFHKIPEGAMKEYYVKKISDSLIELTKKLGMSEDSKISLWQEKYLINQENVSFKLSQKKVEIKELEVNYKPIGAYRITTEDDGTGALIVELEVLPYYAEESTIKETVQIKSYTPIAAKLSFNLDNVRIVRIAGGSTYFMFKSDDPYLANITECSFSYQVKTNSYTDSGSNNPCFAFYTHDPQVIGKGWGKIELMIAWLGSTGSGSVDMDLKDVCGNSFHASESASW
ncbi:MAG: hypothetical protein ABIE74_07965 [Pseudomonadota bacterium]